MRAADFCVFCDYRILCAKWQATDVGKCRSAAEME